MPLQQDGGMVMQDIPGLRGNLLPGHKPSFNLLCFTRTNLVGGHQGVSEQNMNSSSVLVVRVSVTFTACGFLKSQPPGSMGGALLY